MTQACYYYTHLKTVGSWSALVLDAFKLIFMQCGFKSAARGISRSRGHCQYSVVVAIRKVVVVLAGKAVLVVLSLVLILVMVVFMAVVVVADVFALMQLRSFRCRFAVAGLWKGGRWMLQLVCGGGVSGGAVKSVYSC